LSFQTLKGLIRLVKLQGDRAVLF